MARESRRINLTLVYGMVSAAFVVLTGAILGLLWSTQMNLREQSYDSSGLAALQTRLHFERLVTKLNVLEAERSRQSTEAAALEYDILYGRLRDLPNRPPYDRFLDDEVLGLLGEIRETYGSFADAFDEAAETGNPGALDGVLPAVTAMRPTIERMAGRAVQLAATYRTDQREDLRMQSYGLIIFVVGLIISASLFMVMLWRNLRTEVRRKQELADLTKKQERTQREAIEANRAKSEFLASMSHELRTPLNAISGFADMLLTVDDFRKDPDKVEELLRDIHSSSIHLQSLIDDVLDLARVESGQHVLSPETFRALPFVREVAEPLALSMGGDGQSLVVGDGGEELMVVADRRSFQQVLQNLIANSLRHGGETVNISVEIEVADDGEAVAVSVSDDGPGMPEELVEAIGQPFIHSRSPYVVNEPAGTGLGLSIVTELLRLNQARLEVAHSQERGVTMRTIWPVGAA